MYKKFEGKDFYDNFKLPILNTKYSRRLILIFLDLSIFILSLSISKLILDINFNPNFQLSLYFLLIGIPIYILMGQYKGIIRYTNNQTFYQIFLRYTVSHLIIFFIFNINFKLPFSLITFITLLSIILSSLLRFFIKDALNQLIRSKNSNQIKKVAIYGAGRAGVQLANSINLSKSHKILAFIDDSEKLWNRSVYDINIYSPAILSILSKDLDQVLLAIPSLKKKRFNEIVEFINKNNLEALQIPSIEDLTSGYEKISKLKLIKSSDLLGRKKILPNQNLLEKSIRGMVIFVVGAGGSIGSELCRKIIKLNPKELIILDSCEENLYSIEKDIANLLSENLNLKSYLGSACDRKLIRNIFNTNNINIVFHAAAYKHVPLVEENKIIGLKNNIFSTKILCELSYEYKIDNFILISSDKAVRPSNVMGASKRLSELIVQAYSKISAEEHKRNKVDKKSLFSMVRFGNVLDSSGSVVPLFKKQIDEGGPITITHPEITRYFMTISEASELVIQSIKLTEGGEVFLLDMGKPVKITNLAEQLIKLSGLTLKNDKNVDGDIELKFIGLRPGEKLYEELLIDAESIPTEHPLIFKADEKYISPQILFSKLEDLERELLAFNEKNSLKCLKTIVDDWNITTI